MLYSGRKSILTKNIFPMKNNRKKYNLNELVDILSVIENDDGQWGIGQLHTRGVISFCMPGILSESPLRDLKDYRGACGEGGFIFTDFHILRRRRSTIEKPYATIWVLFDSTLFLTALDYSCTSLSFGAASDRVYRSMEIFWGNNPFVAKRWNCRHSE